MEKKLFVIACGGTGGHVSPGIAVGQRLMANGHRCVLLISQKTVDRQLCAAYPMFQIIAMPGIGLTVGRWAWFRCCLAAVKNVLQAWRLLRSMRADAVIGFGGFSNVGVVVAAALLRKPCVLHEANRVMGRTVRWLGICATRLYVPQQVICGRFWKKLLGSKMQTCGFPLRQEMHKVDRSEAKRHLGFDASRPLLVVMGGSQGARALTQWVVDHADTLLERNIQVLCLTGLQAVIPETAPLGCKFLSFSDRMAWVYSAADLMVCRAGAGTIAELIRCETPSILVPFPQAADGHQLANARALQQQGGCEILKQTHMDQLWERVVSLLSGPHQLQTYAQALRRMDTTDWADWLAKAVVTLEDHFS